MKVNPEMIKCGFALKKLLFEINFSIFIEIEIELIIGFIHTLYR